MKRVSCPRAKIKGDLMTFLLLPPRLEELNFALRRLDVTGSTTEATTLVAPFLSRCVSTRYIL